MVGGPGYLNLQSLLSVCIVSGFLETTTVVGGPWDPNLKSVLCIVSGFLESVAVIGGPGDPNLQSVLGVCLVSGFLEADTVIGGQGRILTSNPHLLCV